MNKQPPVHPAKVPRPANRVGGVTTACCGAVGIAGSIACSLAMVAAAAGLLGAGASTGARASAGSMAHMGLSAGRNPGWIDFLVRNGPALLVASLALVIGAAAVRRRSAVLPAALGGAILYVGMYRQSSTGWMYAAIGSGTLLLVGAFAAILQPPRRSGGRREARMSSL